MKVHKLKTLSQYFELQINGSKNFELRKNDRDFKVFDEIILIELINTSALGELKESGRKHRVVITCILSGWEGLDDGYVILGTQPVA